MARCPRSDCVNGQIQTPSNSGPGGSYPCNDPVHSEPDQDTSTKQDDDRR